MQICHQFSSSLSISIIILLIESSLSLYIMYLLYKEVARQIEKEKIEYYDLILTILSVINIASSYLNLFINNSQLIDYLINISNYLLLSVLIVSFLFLFLLKHGKNNMNTFKYVLYSLMIIFLLITLTYCISYIIYYNQELNKCLSYKVNLQKFVSFINFILSLILFVFILYSISNSDSPDSSYLLYDKIYHLEYLFIKQMKEIINQQKYYFFVVFSIFLSCIIDFIFLFLTNSNMDTLYDSNDLGCFVFYEISNLSNGFICLVMFFIHSQLVSISIIFCIKIKPKDNSNKAFIEMM